MTQPTPEMQEEFEGHIRMRRIRTLSKVVGGNAVLGAMSFVGAAFGGGNVSVAEGLHDSSDAATHSADLAGVAARNNKLKKALRYVAGGGVVAVNVGFMWKAGIDLSSGASEVPEVAPIVTQTVVAGANVGIHTVHDKEQHEIAHEIEEAKAAGYDTSMLEDDEHMSGAHTHTKGDAIVSPLLLGGMVLAYATKIPEFGDAFAMGGAGYTAYLNSRELLKPAHKH